MKIIFWGTPEYSVPSLKSLIDSKFEISAVVTQPDKKRSRGKNLIPSPIKKLSTLNGIPVLCPENIKENKNLISKLKSFNSDVFIVIAYGKILSKDILDIPKFGCWNAHASLLPRWRGAAPIHWSILSGDKYTGVGIMKMEEGLDTGDLLIEEKIKIDNDDNLLTLSNKLSKLSAELLINTLKNIEIKHEGIMKSLTPQNALKRKPSYARIIDKKDFLIKLNDTAENIEKKVNGLYPRAFIYYKNKNLKILKIKILKKKSLIVGNDFKNKENGVVLDILKNEGIVLSTKTDPIVLLEIKLEGKGNSTKSSLIQQLNVKIGSNFL